MITLTSSLISHEYLLQRNPRFHLPTKRNPSFFIVHSSLEEKELNSSIQFPPIKKPKRVVLVRHGQSTWNEEGRIQGSSNFSILTKKGESQAQTSRQMLINDNFDVCFTSPLNRSKRTAEIIWDLRREVMIPDYDLREIDLYSFQGLLKREGKERFGEAFKQWQKNAPNFKIDGHYPVRELWDRARNCWDKILAHEGESVLVVAHNAVNQALVATAMGLSTEYFRVLLQSNCGVSVLDFTPRAEKESPYISLNRLNQTPNSPIAPTSSAGRKSSKTIVLVCYGSTLQNVETTFSNSSGGSLNMLGIIQSHKIAELLLDLKLSSIISAPQIASIETAKAISKVQEAADCLGADSVPLYVEMKQLQDLEVESILEKSKKDEMELFHLQPGWLNTLEDGARAELWSHSERVWKSLLDDLRNEPEEEGNLVIVGHPTANIGLVTHCLNLSEEWMGSFQLNAGSISVIDFPDGPVERGVVRCLNYTAHLGRWSIPVTKLR